MVRAKFVSLLCSAERGFKPLVLLLCVSMSYPHANEPPQWLFEMEAVYPQETYMTAVGSGENRELAEQDALSRLAQHFSVSIKTRTDAAVNYDSRNSNRVEQQIETHIQLATSETLVGVEFSDPYRESPQITRVVALLERGQAARGIAQRINRRIAERDALVDRAEATRRVPIRRFALLRAAEEAQQPLPALLSRFSVVTAHQSRTALYEARIDPEPLAALLDEARQSISVRLAVDDTTGGAGTSALRQALLAEGFTISERGNTVLSGAISLEESPEHPRYTVMRWSIGLEFEDGDGRGVLALADSGRTVGANRALALQSSKLEIARAVGTLLHQHLATTAERQQSEHQQSR